MTIKRFINKIILVTKNSVGVVCQIHHDATAYEYGANVTIDVRCHNN